MKSCDTGAAGGLAPVDHPLDLDVGAGFELQISLVLVLGKIAGERALDVDGQSVMALDEVRIVAVHRADQVAHPGADDGVQPSRQSVRLRDQVGGEVFKVLLLLFGQHRLHACGRGHFCRFRCR